MMPGALYQPNSCSEEDTEDGALANFITGGRGRY